MKSKIFAKCKKWGYFLGGLGCCFLSAIFLPPFLQKLLISFVCFMGSIYLFAEFFAMREEEKTAEDTEETDEMMEVFDDRKNPNDD